MKKVFEITVKGKFAQYLMLSEHRYLKDICEGFGSATFKVVEISIAKYKIEFGK